MRLINGRLRRLLRHTIETQRRQICANRPTLPLQNVNATLERIGDAVCTLR